jgi:hypothetical protein
MSKQLIIRLFMIAFIISAGLFVVAAVRTARPTAETEECNQDETECVDKSTQSEFLLEALTRNLLNR